MPLKLPKRIIDLIAAKLSQPFEAIKSKLLVIGSTKKDTLPSVYTDIVKEHGGVPDPETLKHLTETTEKYLESVKLNAINKAANAIKGTLAEKKTPEEVEKVLRETWSGVIDKVKQIVETESTAYRNTGALEATLRVAGARGIEDPTVYFATARDSGVCAKTCRRLHLLENNITPRVWKLSEVSGSYIKTDSLVPALTGGHPFCRCIGPLLVLDGFGFKGGNLSYISADHDEFKKQRGIA